MSKNSTIKVLEYELDIINRQIDMKIITGRNYKKDALRHKSLLAQLRGLKAQESHGWMNRLSHTFATFIF